jgi:DNA-binding GntR family transcriptional regulator
VIKMLDQIRDSVRRLRTISTAVPGRQEAALKGHIEIAELVIAGDAEGAGALAHKHVWVAAQVLLDSIQGTAQE